MVGRDQKTKAVLGYMEGHYRADTGTNQSRSEAMFDIGQRVICIKTRPPDPPGFIDMPVVGDVYTIRQFIEDRETKKIGLQLEEIRNPISQFAPNGDWGEGAFKIEWFRPLPEKDIKDYISDNVFDGIRRITAATIKQLRDSVRSTMDLLVL